MNVATPIASSTPAISEAECARRLSEVNFARGSVRYEGGIVSDEIERLNARYVAGEITSDKLTALSWHQTQFALLKLVYPNW